MCGEKDRRRRSSGRFPGSPPHVRGKESSVGVSAVQEGITPACAGKSRKEGGLR